MNIQNMIMIKLTKMSMIYYNMIIDYYDILNILYYNEMNIMLVYVINQYDIYNDR